MQQDLEQSQANIICFLGAASKAQLQAAGYVQSQGHIRTVQPSLRCTILKHVKHHFPCAASRARHRAGNDITEKKIGEPYREQPTGRTAGTVKTRCNHRGAHLHDYFGWLAAPVLKTSLVCFAGAVELAFGFGPTSTAGCPNRSTLWDGLLS